MNGGLGMALAGGLLAYFGFKGRVPLIGIIGVFLLIIGLLWAVGAGKQESRRKRVSIYCAKCDQYLGTANGFDSPCPRCGSNRYTRS
jgi:drug/metabolite transporter (DMT)-like permease